MNNETVELKRTLKYISHEMLNALTIVNYSVKEIERNNKSLSNDEYWGFLMDDIKHMTMIIKDLSKYNHSGSLMCKEQNLNDVLKEVVIEMKNTYKKDALIEYENSEDSSDYEAFIDEYKIRQVFINIIKNAVEATNGCEKGKVSVGINREDKWINIYCKDNGVGIEEKNIKRIFEEGVTINKKEGSGLGLPISKKIIEGHRGEIEVTSSPDGGTTFEIKIPILESK